MHLTCRGKSTTDFLSLKSSMNWINADKNIRFDDEQQELQEKMIKCQRSLTWTFKFRYWNDDANDKNYETQIAYDAKRLNVNVTSLQANNENK